LTELSGMISRYISLPTAAAMSTLETGARRAIWGRFSRRHAMPRNGVERIQYEIPEGDASGDNARLAAPAGEHRCQRAKAGWHAAHLSPRQPRQHVDPRRGHDFGRGADHAHFQQPRPVQPAREAESTRQY